MGKVEGGGGHQAVAALQGGLARDGDHAAHSGVLSGEGAHAAQAHGGAVGHAHLVVGLAGAGGGGAHDQRHVDVLLLVNAPQLLVHVLWEVGRHVLVLWFRVFSP